MDMRNITLRSSRLGRARPRCRFIWPTLMLCAVGCQQPRPMATSRPQSAEPTGRGYAEINAIALILPPMIDGKLEEGIWNHTPAYSDFAAIGTDQRVPVRQTEFRIAYDAANVYVALTCRVDPRVGVPEVRHWQNDDEGIAEDESCRIQFWPHPAPPGVYYEIIINPEGLVCDARRHGRCPLRSTCWNGPTQAAATRSEGAWRAEIRTPLKWMGIPDQPWRVNVIRNDALAGEGSQLARIASPSTGKKPATAILRWPAPARPFLTGPLPIRQLSINDMERTDQAWQTRAATATPSNQHVSNGRRSLAIAFQARGAISLTPRNDDFSGWQTLRFGMFLPMKGPTTMGVRLRDVFGRASTGWFQVKPGDNDVSLPLDLLGAGLRLRNTKTIEILSQQAATVWIDRVRLVEDSLSYHENPHRPERPSRSTLAVRVDPAVQEALESKLPPAVDVVVPLFRTRKVRRLQRRTVSHTASLTFEPGKFAGHDTRDPVRITAFVRSGDDGYFAFRDMNLSRSHEDITFFKEHFPPLPTAAGPEVP